MSSTLRKQKAGHVDLLAHSECSRRHFANIDNQVINADSQCFSDSLSSLYANRIFALMFNLINCSRRDLGFPGQRSNAHAASLSPVSQLYLNVGYIPVHGFSCKQNARFPYHKSSILVPQNQSLTKHLQNTYLYVTL